MQLADGDGAESASLDPDDGFSGATRPGDDDVVPVARALRWQESYCRGHGAPVAAELLAAVAADVEAGGPLASVIPDRVRFGDLVGLRVMATAHLLALRREAPGLAVSLPTLGGTPPDPADARAIQGVRDEAVRVLAQQPDLLRDMLGRVPQTNETGRASLLRAGLAALGPDRPIRLVELGASAGLNLRADHLPGDPALEAGPLPRVVERVGYDRHPVDATTTAGRLLLSSYVWVDDVARFERLRTALGVAARVPATLVRGDLVTAVNEDVVLVPGTTTVVWHSAMWVYLRAEQRVRVLAGLRALGATATTDARLAHLSWEWRPEGGRGRETFELVLRQWAGTASGEVPAGGVPAGGVPVRLAIGSSHGIPARRVDAEVLAREPLGERPPR